MKIAYLNKVNDKQKANYEYMLKWFGKMNVAFLNDNCAIVLNKSKKEEMVANCLDIIEEIKKGSKFVTKHILEDGHGMIIMGSKKFFIHSISEEEISAEEIKNDKMLDERVELLVAKANEALENPNINALGLRHEYINFMEDHFWSEQ